MIAQGSKQIQPAMEVAKKLLKVALIGSPNAGKSTLLNRLIMSEVSCVSNKVHTTRQNTLGVYTENDTQLKFFDSPGLVTRKHVLRHHLEDSLIDDPKQASQLCDLIGVIVDASNLRDCKRLNRNILSILREHEDKKSFLIINKVDLIKDKRILLDIATRLTDGHLDGKLTCDLQALDSIRRKYSPKFIRPTSPYVIELNKESPDQIVNDENAAKELPLGHRNFSRVFSISALQDDGVDELRENLIQLAQPVPEWPHAPDFLTNQSAQKIVHAIIRGNVMDSVDEQIPYVAKYNYLQCKIDSMGSLHVDLEIVVPKKYMIGKLLGKHGAVIFKITNESRERIQKQLACDTKLNITVNSRER